MVDFLAKHNLNPSQHGFVKASSFLTNMLPYVFLEETTKLKDEGSPVNIIYLDFQKTSINFHIKDYYLN